LVFSIGERVPRFRVQLETFSDITSGQSYSLTITGVQKADQQKADKNYKAVKRDKKEAESKEVVGVDSAAKLIAEAIKGAFAQMNASARGLTFVDSRPYE
jgi:multimeric flavodoxin WrbA